MLGLYFLGTSSGVPTKERNVSGIALKLPEPKSWVLVDCGEGTQHQILSSPLSLLSLKAICITHVHGDHCYGLPGLLASAGMSGRTAPLKIIAPKEVEQMFDAIKIASDLYLPYEVEFIETNTANKIELDGVSITPIKLSHRVESHAFCFDSQLTKSELRHKKLIESGVQSGPLWGEIKRGNNVTLDDGQVIKASEYIDTKSFKNRVVIAGDNDDLTLLNNVIDSADVLVHESTYTEALLEKIGPSPQHSSALRVAKFSQSVKLPCLILTHFSARFQSKDKNLKNSIEEIRQEAQSAFSGTLFLANDHDSFSVSDDGVVIHNEEENV